MKKYTLSDCYRRGSSRATPKTPSAAADKTAHINRDGSISYVNYVADGYSGNWSPAPDELRDDWTNDTSGFVGGEAQ